MGVPLGLGEPVRSLAKSPMSWKGLQQPWLPGLSRAQVDTSLSSFLSVFSIYFPHYYTKTAGVFYEFGSFGLFGVLR